MFKREASPLAEILQRCLRQDGLETPLLQKRAIDSWEKVVGKAVSRYTGDKFIKNQVLFVKIQNPALRSDLTMMRSRILANINAEVGSKVVADIRFF